VRLVGAAAAVLVANGVSAADGAGPTATLRAQASSLSARTHQALLGLYVLDTRLHAARARLATLEAQATRLRSEEAQLSQQLGATRRTLTISQGQLGDQISMLYKEGNVSALAVVLGSRSLDDALTRLDDLNRVADQSRQVIQVAASTQSRVHTLRTRLRARRAALAAALSDARGQAAALESDRADRLGFIAGLRREQRLKAGEIDALQTNAKRVERKSDALQAAAVAEAPTTPAPASTPVRTATAGHTLTVLSTGYSLAGYTATGMPVGWGVVAVDPAVIPLGTRLTIPGYGEAVAADTGGGVRGDTIDIWFPTGAQARGWGRRTVTITLH
jgi:3D (Asp-Asp-Asp) domain-containing protein